MAVRVEAGRIVLVTHFDEPSNQFDIGVASDSNHQARVSVDSMVVEWLVIDGECVFAMVVTLCEADALGKRVDVANVERTRRRRSLCLYCAQGGFGRTWPALSDGLDMHIVICWIRQELQLERSSSNTLSGGEIDLLYCASKSLAQGGMRWR